MFYLGGKSGGKGKNQVKSQVGTPSASGRSLVKFPSIRETPKGETTFRGTFCRAITKASNPKISSLTKTSPPPTEIRYPMGTPEKSFPDFRMYARWSATWLPLLWSLGDILILSLPPICRPNSQQSFCFP